MMSNEKILRPESPLANLTDEQFVLLRKKGLNNGAMKWVADIQDPERRERACLWIVEKNLTALTATLVAGTLPPMRNLTEDQILMLAKEHVNSQDIAFVDSIIEDAKRAAVLGLIAEGLKAPEAIHQVLTCGSYHNWLNSRTREVHKRIPQDERIEIEEPRYSMDVDTQLSLLHMKSAADRREILALIKAGMDSKAALNHVLDRPRPDSDTKGDGRTDNRTDGRFSNAELEIFDQRQVGTLDRRSIGMMKNPQQRREVVNLIAFGVTPREAFRQVLGPDRPARLSDTILVDAAIAKGLTADQLLDLELRGIDRAGMARIAMIPDAEDRNYAAGMITGGCRVDATLAAIEERNKPESERRADWMDILMERVPVPTKPKS